MIEMDKNEKWKHRWSIRIRQAREEGKVEKWYRTGKVETWPTRMKEPRLTLRRKDCDSQSRGCSPKCQDALQKWPLLQLGSHSVGTRSKAENSAPGLLPLTSPDSHCHEHWSKLYRCVKVCHSNQACQNFTGVLSPLTLWQFSRPLCLYKPYLSYKPSSPPWGQPALISHPWPQPEALV